MERDRAYRRAQRFNHIKRKINMLHLYGGADYVNAWIRGKPGRLAKGKIHCSCPMCRSKSYDEISHGDKQRRAKVEAEVE